MEIVCFLTMMRQLGGTFCREVRVNTDVSRNGGQIDDFRLPFNVEILVACMIPGI